MEAVGSRQSAIVDIGKGEKRRALKERADVNCGKLLYQNEKMPDDDYCAVRVRDSRKATLV